MARGRDGLVFAALSNLFLGATITATRFVVDGADPLTLAFLRIAIATVVMAPVAMRPPVGRFARKDVPAVLGLGVLLFGAFPYTYTTAIAHTTASSAAVVFATVPLLTLSIAALLRVERFTPLKLLGAVLALVGVGLAVGGPRGAGGAAGYTGELYMGLTVVMGASFNVLSRRLLLTYSASHLTAAFLATGTAVLAPFAWADLAAHGLPAYSAFEWGVVVFTGVVGGAWAYYCFIAALARATPARVAVFVALNPVTATILAVALLGERLTPGFLAGLACVIAGILAANWRKEAGPAP